MSRTVSFRNVAVGGLNIFYREAGHANAPKILLLHGFPTSSHMFRNLIPYLGGKYHVIAPDLPGFGFSDAPPRARYQYTFDALSQTMAGFTDALGLRKFALYVFDYGAPVGFRLALAQPERITALISQNGNAYEEGLSEGWSPIKRYWQDPKPENREALRAFLTIETTRWQYTHGVDDADARVAPETWLLDQTMLDRPQSADIQLDLFGDYKTNVALYPTFHAYFREHRPPTLAVWGRNDPFFLPAGAEAYRRDNPEAEVRFVDSGHFPLETHAADIARIILGFLSRAVDQETERLFDKTASKRSASPALHELAQMLGFTPNLGAVMASEEPALAAYVNGLKALAASSLTPVEQQIAMLVASRANRAAYGVAIHAALAKRLGARADVVRAATMGEAITEDRTLAALQEFVSALVENRGDAGDAAISAFLAAGYTAQHAVAVALAVSLKTFANTVSHLSRVSLDPEITSFADAA